MALTFKAAAAFHFNGVSYDPADTVDTTGFTDRDFRNLMKRCPVYVAENIGSLALSPKQEYGFQGLGTTPANGDRVTLETTVSYPNDAGDLTIPDAGDPAVITVNSSGLYSCFFSPIWLTHASSTGIRQFDWADGDGNWLWAEIMSGEDSTALGVHGTAYTSLLYLPAGLVLTLEARQLGGSTEDARCDVDIFRML